MKCLGRLLLVAAIVASGAAAVPSPVAGYNPTAAARYADAHWIDCASGLFKPDSPFQCFDNDCTNYASIVLNRGGGYGMTGTPNGTSRTDDHYWWYWRDGGICLWDCTHWTWSWSFAKHLRQFLIYDYPGGWWRGTRSGMDTSASDDVGTGDLLFFNWGTGEGWSHIRIQVGYGYSYDNHYGAYTDQHSNNRYHAFWSAYYENAAHRTTTTIYEMYVDTRN